MQAVKEKLDIVFTSDGVQVVSAGRLLGQILFREADFEGRTEFYVYDLEASYRAPKEVASMLFQAVMSKAKELGYDSIVGNVKVDAPTFRLLKNPRASLVACIIRMETSGKHGRLSN